MSQIGREWHFRDMGATNPDISRLFARHGDELLVFLVRRTADVELALDLWSETFAQAVVSSGRYRGSGDLEGVGDPLRALDGCEVCAGNTEDIAKLGERR